MASALASLSPDIIVLTEYVPGTTRTAFLADLASFEYSHTLMSQEKPGHNHILIAAKTPIEAGQIRVPALAEAFPSNVLDANLPESRDRDPRDKNADPAENSDTICLLGLDYHNCLYLTE